MTKTNKTTLIQNVRSLLSEAVGPDYDCPAYGREIAAAVKELQFHGAGVAEIRRLSDTGLSNDELLHMHSFYLPFDLAGAISDTVV